MRAREAGIVGDQPEMVGVEPAVVRVQHAQIQVQCAACVGRREPAVERSSRSPSVTYTSRATCLMSALTGEEADNFRSFHHIMGDTLKDCCCDVRPGGREVSSDVSCAAGIAGAYDGRGGGSSDAVFGTWRCERERPASEARRCIGAPRGLVDACVSALGKATEAHDGRTLRRRMGEDQYCSENYSRERMKRTWVIDFRGTGRC